MDTAISAEMHDPLRPTGYRKLTVLPTNKEKTWHVNEILSSEGRRLAIVNDKTVKKGDSINGAKVIDISRHQVTLKYKNRIIYSPVVLVPVKKLVNPGVGR